MVVLSCLVFVRSKQLKPPTGRDWAHPPWAGGDRAGHGQLPSSALHAPAPLLDAPFPAPPPPRSDRMLPRKGRMDMLDIKTYDEIKHMMDLGYQYAARLHKDGRFNA